MDAFCLRTATSNPLTRTMATTLTSTDLVESKLAVTGFTVSVNPNPATSFFNLTVSTSDNITPVNLRILDIEGRVLGLQKTAANSSVKIKAEKWRSGVYFVEVIQGDQRKVVKLVKTY
jgi:hypothetical protein